MFMESDGKSQGAAIDLRSGVVGREWRGRRGKGGKEGGREGGKRRERERLLQVKQLCIQRWLHLEVLDKAAKLNRICTISFGSVSSRMFLTQFLPECSTAHPRAVGMDSSWTQQCSLQMGQAVIPVKSQSITKMEA